MSNSGISYETVAPLIDELVAKGVYPTISKIRESLGHQGSVPVLNRYLKQWRENFKGELPPMPVSEPRLVRSLPIEADEERQPVFPAGDSEGSLVNPTFSNSATQLPLFTESSDNTTAHQPQPSESTATAPRAEGLKRGPKIERRKIDPIDSPRTQRRPHPEKPRHHDALEESEGYMPPLKRVDFDKPYPEVPENLQNLSSESFKLPRATEPTSIEILQSLRKEDLITKVRRLESALQKEQLRAEASEKIAYDAKRYADTVKGMVAERIHATRDEMQKTIDQLKLEAREQKMVTEKKLLEYRDQLNKISQKIVELMPVQES